MSLWNLLVSDLLRRDCRPGDRVNQTNRQLRIFFSLRDPEADPEADPEHRIPTGQYAAIPAPRAKSDR